MNNLVRINLPADEAPAFAADLLAGLRRQPKSLPCKYFYDAAGSALFDQICALPEYYPTRTELALLKDRAGEIAEKIGPEAEIVEFGAGSLRKVRLLLDALPSPRGFVPIDISAEHLHLAAEALRRDYPGLIVRPLAADYTRPFALPAMPKGARRRVGFFPGSTIGNFAPDDAVRFLRNAARLLRGGALLIGVDLVKHPAMLHAAYNDAAGVTAAFNLNLLARANRELGADFDLSGFAHYAFYNAPWRRIEMHLVSRRMQTVRVQDEEIRFSEGEAIHTEDSYKYTPDGFAAMAASAGFTPRQVWTDSARLFSLHWLESAA